MRTSTLICMAFLLVLNEGRSQSAGEAIRLRQHEFGFGASTLAMGGNGVALANDYSTIYWNPAGLASLNENEVMVEFSHLRFNNQATFAGDLNDMNESFTRLRSLGLAVPLPTERGSLVLGFGYNFVKDFDDYLFFSGFNHRSNGLEFQLEDENGIADWYAFDKNVLQTEEVLTEGGLHQWSFSAGMALSPHFDVGAAANFWRGNDEYRLHFRQEDTRDFYHIFPGDFFSYSLNQELMTEYSAFNLKLGGMFTLNRYARLGMAVEFPTTFTVKESYAESDELVFDDGFTDAVDYEPGEWEYQVKTPFRFDAGLALRSGNLKLSGAATYQDWTQTRFQKPDQASLDQDYSELLAENQFLRQDYRETVNYHLGGELTLPTSKLALRGGYAYYPTPLKNAPSGMNRKYYSGGVGLNIGMNTRLDLTYVRGTWQRETEDSYTPGGTLEKVTENRIFVGFKYLF